MKYIAYVLLVFALLGLIFFLTKNNNQKGTKVELTKEDNGKTIQINKNDVIKITLSDPGDGGYSFKDPQYNKNILRQIEYKHEQPTNDLPVTKLGDFGKDVWTFKATRIGKTSLNYEIYRSWAENESPIEYFNIFINVN